MAKPEEFEIGAVFIIKTPIEHTSNWYNIIYKVIEKTNNSQTYKVWNNKRINFTIIWNNSYIAKYSIKLPNNIWKILYDNSKD